MILVHLLACATQPGAPPVTEADPLDALWAPVIAIEPAAPSEEHDLAAVTLVAAQSPAGEAIATTLWWTRDGERVDALDELTYVPAAETLAGETWELVVTTTAGDEERVITDSVTIDAVGTDLTVTITPDEPTTDDVLTAESSEPATLAWYRDGAFILEGATVEADLTARGQLWQVFASDTDTLAPPWDAVTIANTVPTVDRVEIEPAEPRWDTGATCVPVGWKDADDDLPGYHYSWLVDGVEVDDTDDTLDVGTFAAGQGLVCRVIPDDGEDLGALVSSDEIVAVNGPPTAPGAASLTPDPPVAGSPCSVSLEVAATDPDGDSVVHSTSWFIDGDLAATGTTIGGGALSEGASVVVQITATDGELQSEPLELTATVAAP